MSAIIEWIDGLRHSDFVITNFMMFNCFRYSWINSSLDESEDDKFSGYKNIEKINKIIKIKNDELY